MEKKSNRRGAWFPRGQDANTLEVVAETMRLDAGCRTVADFILEYGLRAGLGLKPPLQPNGFLC